MRINGRRQRAEMGSLDTLEERRPNDRARIEGAGHVV